MGVFVDYALRAEGTAEEVMSRLMKVRQRCMDLPLQSVDIVRHVSPVYNPVVLSLYEKNGFVVPVEVAQRVQAAEADSDNGSLCMSFGIIPGRELPEKEIERYIAPAVELIESTDLWRHNDLPEKIVESVFNLNVLTVFRDGIEFEFANVLLRHGYLLILDPGEGSETIQLGLATYGLPANPKQGELPLWYGDSFTRTQYADNFVLVHETVCKVLDIVQEEGLLLSGNDTCGYYGSRSWAEAGDIVNDELAFAKFASDAIGLGIGNIREEGGHVEVLVDNASKARPVDFTDALAHEKKDRPSGSRPSGDSQ